MSGLTSAQLDELHEVCQGFSNGCRAGAVDGEGEAYMTGIEKALQAATDVVDSVWDDLPFGTDARIARAAVLAFLREMPLKWMRGGLIFEPTAADMIAAIEEAGK